MSEVFRRGRYAAAWLRLRLLIGICEHDRISQHASGGMFKDSVYVRVFSSSIVHDVILPDGLVARLRAVWHVNGRVSQLRRES